MSPSSSPRASRAVDFLVSRSDLRVASIYHREMASLGLAWSYIYRQPLVVRRSSLPKAIEPFSSSHRAPALTDPLLHESGARAPGE